MQKITQSKTFRRMLLVVGVIPLVVAVLGINAVSAATSTSNLNPGDTLTVTCNNSNLNLDVVTNKILNIICKAASTTPPTTPPTPPTPPVVPPPTNPAITYNFTLTSKQEVPANNSNATGTAKVTLDGSSIYVTLSGLTGLSSSQTAAHIHGPAAAGANAGVLFTLPNGNFTNHKIDLSASQITDLKAGKYYINVHTANFPNGEVRGQVENSAATSGVGKCGESNDSWHPPVINGCATGHEHGDAPPSWIAQAGYNLSFTGHFNTSAVENSTKHTSMKGMLITIQGVQIYFRTHFASNPMERFGDYHSYEVFTKDAAGGVSHWQGWNFSGKPNSDARCLRRRDPLPCENERPIILVTDQTSWDQGITCEQWYSATASWSWDFGVTICGSTTIYQPDKEKDSATVFDQSTWKLAPNNGSLGLTRRLEVAWYGATQSDGKPYRQHPTGKFWATQFGEIVSGPSDARCTQTTTKFNVVYKNVCLEQYIAPTMTKVAFPGNAVQKSFPGQGVQIPN